MKRGTLTLLAALLAAGPALAADQNDDFRVKGVGLETCAAYLQAKGQGGPLYVVSRSWLNGYLTAYNQLTPNTYDIAGNANIDGLTNWVDAFCQQNPNTTLVTAAINLMQALGPNRIAQKPASGGATVDRSTLRQVQTVLKQKGFYEGGVDGLFGPGTRAAIVAYQRAENLPVTGEPDQNTLARLFN